MQYRFFNYFQAIKLLQLNTKLYQPHKNKHFSYSNLNKNNNKIDYENYSTVSKYNTKGQINSKDDFYSTDEILEYIKKNYVLDKQKLLNSMLIGIDEKMYF